MTAAQSAAYVFARLARFYMEVEAMKAENQNRECHGYALAYLEHNFTALSEEYSDVLDPEKLVKLFERAKP